MPRHVLPVSELRRATVQITHRSNQRIRLPTRGPSATLPIGQKPSASTPCRHCAGVESCRLMCSQPGCPTSGINHGGDITESFPIGPRTLLQLLDMGWYEGTMIWDIWLVGYRPTQSVCAQKRKTIRTPDTGIACHRVTPYWGPVRPEPRGSSLAPHWKYFP